MAERERGIERELSIGQVLIVIPLSVLSVMCYPGTNARAHVEAQGVPAESAGLLEDDPVPEVAEDGCPAG